MPGEKPRAMPGLVAVLVVLVAASVAQEDVTDHILNSLSRAAAFLESEHEHINLDGVVGYLILQAELKEAVRTWPHSDPQSWAQRTSTVALLRRLDQSLAKAAIALQRHDPKYYRASARARAASELLSIELSEFEPLLDCGAGRSPGVGLHGPRLRYASRPSPASATIEQPERLLH
ncbi:unnamed protein product [Boreogadus saida]